MNDRRRWVAVSIACIALLAGGCRSSAEDANDESPPATTADPKAIAEQAATGFATPEQYEAALSVAEDRDRFFEDKNQVRLAIESTRPDARCDWTPISTARDLLAPITELPDDAIRERAAAWIEDYTEVETICLAGFHQGAFAQHQQTRDEFDEIIGLIEQRAAEAVE